MDAPAPAPTNVPTMLRAGTYHYVDRPGAPAAGRRHPRGLEPIARSRDVEPEDADDRARLAVHQREI
jgi:hypothetical protein